jgi:hypothetical protein
VIALVVLLLLILVSAIAGLVRIYLLLVRGAITVVRPKHRSTKALGPIRVRVSAPRDVVFDTIAAPYLGRAPASLKDKLEVLDRWDDTVLAAHHTPTPRGISTTVETVRFIRPERVEFRLLQGPVSHTTEHFHLREVEGGTEIEYAGELGVDLPLIASWYAKKVVPIWNRTVERSLEGVKASAEERARAHARRD